VRVSIKDLQVRMDLGNNGIELDVYDGEGEHLGDLCIGRGRVEWCHGRTRRGNGKSVTWQRLIEWFEEQE